MIYLDTSALVKLILDEPESRGLGRHVTGEQIAVSALSRTELRRVCLRLHQPQLPVERLLSGCHQVALGADVLNEAGLLLPPTLRSLDAIHLASALMVRFQLTEFIAYDRRLCEAAEVAGFRVVCPR